MFVFRIFRSSSGSDWQYVSHRGNDRVSTSAIENDDQPMGPSDQDGPIV